jgi:hypothetical protein
MRRILFISDYAPTESNSGGIVMTEQLLYLKQYAEIDFLIYSSEMVEYRALKTKSGKIHQRVKLGERQIDFKKKRVKRLVEVIFSQTVLRLWLMQEKRFLKEIFKQGDYSEIFITVQGLYLAKLLVDFEFKSNSVILQYWDPDVWWAEQHNFTDHSTTEIFETHKSMEKKDYIRHIFVPSEGMALAVRSRSEIDITKVKEFYPSEEFLFERVEPPEAFTNIRKKFSKIVTMAGSTYALEEITILIDTIEEHNRLNPEDEIQLVFIGPKRLSTGKHLLNQGDENGSFIHLLGRLSVAETDACLRRSNLNFLPYPFWNRELVKQSFPSKFSKYLGSGSNMLIAAPIYSSLVVLLSKYGVHEGLVTTLSKTNLSRETLRLLNDSNYSEQQLLKLELIKRELFSSTFFNSSLESAFNVSKEISKEEEVITVTIPVKQTWVHLFNSFVRDLSFWLENLMSPLKTFIFLLYQLLYKLGVIRLIKSRIGENSYEKLLAVLKRRVKF